jgi:hypothetical protein
MRGCTCNITLELERQRQTDRQKDASASERNAEGWRVKGQKEGIESKYGFFSLRSWVRVLAEWMSERKKCQQAFQRRVTPSHPLGHAISRLPYNVMTLFCEFFRGQMSLNLNVYTARSIGHFCQFSSKKLAFFLKTKIQIFQKLAVFSIKIRHNSITALPCKNSLLLTPW